MGSVIRIGSRESMLAVAQAEYIRHEIERICPEIKTELITMKTTGDKILGKSLEAIGGKGLFVKELDQALLENRIDIAVHSLKDMPMEESEELPILAYSKREDPRDVLVYKPGQDGLPKNPVIGTSSKRRKIQTEKLFQDASFCPIRGNVQTRMKKLTNENYDGTILAAAGIRRLHMESIIGRVLEPEEMLPAAGQGILAIQGRKGESYPFLSEINCPESQIAATAERAFVRTLGGGCTSPVAAYAVVEDGQVYLRGLYCEEDKEWFFIDEIRGDGKDAAILGEKLAKSMQDKAKKEGWTK